MPTRRRSRLARRSSSQVRSDARADDVARALGRALRDARSSRGQTQQVLGDLAALAPSTVSEGERGHGADFTLRTWMRLATAAGSGLHAYLERASAAGAPRDPVHLKAQDLVVRTARGGWRAMPEAPLDDAARGSRSADVLLERGGASDLATGVEVALIEVIDWFDDVGAAFRDWDRRLARVARSALVSHTRDIDGGGPRLPLVAGCWVLRATRRNRRLIASHAALFRVRCPGDGREWLAALATHTRMPSAAAMLWISVDGSRLWPARLAATTMR